ncbi:MAG: alpha/beta hydrolase [Planctomycetes bacterium]|nr:alpha/beta hydrolase [Planctomycetota bacterium]
MPLRPLLFAALVAAPLATTCAAEAAAAPATGATFTAGIEYANPADQHLKLDLAMPVGAGPFPAVICIHGGGFRAGTREGYDGFCKTLAAAGYVAATITYRLAPAHPFPAAVQDCKAAVRWLRAHAAEYHVDPARIGATGDSAGGHLALFLGVTAGLKQFEGQENLDQSSAVTCVVDRYGPSDFTRVYGKSVDAAEVLPLFFGGDLKTRLHEHIVGSPLSWITPDAAPTLCIHGTADPYVPFEQSVWAVERFLACGVQAELLTIPGGKHGFGGADAEKAQQGALAFFAAHLHPGQ